MPEERSKIIGNGVRELKRLGAKPERKMASRAALLAEKGLVIHC
jgi:hypothetical protein